MGASRITQMMVQGFEQSYQIPQTDSQMTYGIYVGTHEAFMAYGLFGALPSLIFRA